VGHAHYITVTNGSSDESLDLAIWIDWNRDGDFLDVDEQIIYIDNNYGQGKFLIEVPDDAIVGTTRMRIRTKYYDDNAYACGTTWYGEVEDYTIEVHPTITWTGLSDAFWDNPANWEGGVIPTATDGVTIPASLNVSVRVGTIARCFSLKLDNGATIEVNGTLEVEN
jgi:hypothetical protein